MTLQVLPATEEDIPRLAEVVFAAFTSDPLHMAMFPREHQDTFMAWYHQKLRKGIRDPCMRSMKVVRKANESHPHDTIIAYGRWQFPKTTAKGESQLITTEEEQISFPALGNKPLVDYYVAATNVIRQRVVDESRDIVCQMLATHPEYQGQGAGRLLLQYGIDAAAEVSRCSGTPARIFLEATPEAYSLYKRFGWEDLGDLDRIEIRLEEYGGPSGVLHCTVAMSRLTV